MAEIPVEQGTRADTHSNIVIRMDHLPSGLSFRACVDWRETCRQRAHRVFSVPSANDQSANDWSFGVTYTTN